MKLGTEISCTCMSKNPICLHTVFVLLKIYRVEKNDPLLWQESFSDVDVAKMLERRDIAITHDLNRFNVYR